MEFPKRDKYVWGGSAPLNVSYDFLFNDNTTREYRQESCFARLPSNCNTLKQITLYNLDCSLTKHYRDWYLQYIIDMLKLDANFDDESFTFKAFNCRYKNMLVCSLTRILWEKMWCKDDSCNVVWFLKPLKESKISGKLTRFCSVFKKIPIEKQDYLHDGHLWAPWNTKIKRTKDWLDAKNLNSVNGFFTN